MADIDHSSSSASPEDSIDLNDKEDIKSKLQKFLSQCSDPDFDLDPKQLDYVKEATMVFFDWIKGSLPSYLKQQLGSDLEQFPFLQLVRYIDPALYCQKDINYDRHSSCTRQIEVRIDYLRRGEIKTVIIKPAIYKEAQLDDLNAVLIPDNLSEELKPHRQELMRITNEVWTLNTKLSPFLHRKRSDRFYIGEKERAMENEKIEYGNIQFLNWIKTNRLSMDLNIFLYFSFVFLPSASNNSY